MSVLSSPILLFRRSLQLALTLAPAFVAVGAQSGSSTSSSARPTQSQDDEDTDEDGEDGPPDRTSTRTHSSTRTSGSSVAGSATSGSSTASATGSTTSAISDGSSKRGLQGGSVAAIVFGVLVFLLILGTFLLFWLRRRRRRLAAAQANSNDGSQVNTALISRDPVSIQSPTSPTSANATPWLPAAAYMATPVSDLGLGPEHGDQSQDNHGRASSSIHTLPNPHDSYRDVPQSRSSTMRTTSLHSDRDLPPIPADGSLSSRHTSAPSSLFGALSSAPSAFTYPTLSQVPESGSATDATNVASAVAGSSTGAEVAIMADYQKRLETHHRKESEDAATTGIPVDPPPRYSESDATHPSP